MDKLEKLNKLISLVNDDTVKPSDLKAFIEFLITFINQTNDSFKNLSKENLKLIEEALKTTKDYSSQTLSEIETKTKTSSKETEDKFIELLKQANDFLEEVKKIKTTPGKDGKNGKDGANGIGINGRDGKDGSPDTGEQIVEKINSLDISEENQIDASHIKNLPETGKRGGIGGVRNIRVYDEGAVITKVLKDLDFVGAGVQVSVVDGKVRVSISGGASANESNGETLTPVSGTEFTFAHTPTAGGVRNVWLAENGQLLTPTTDYTVSGATLTTTIDQTGFTLISNYTY